MTDVSASQSGLPRHREPMNIFSVMEDVNDKLKLLDYEQSILRTRTDLKPLSKQYFAIPTKPQEQFPYFAQLAVWLLQQIGMQVEWSEWDDPTQTCSSILEHLRRLQFPLLSDFPAAKLRAGSGEPVIAVLDFLADRALERRGFRVQAPIYSATSNMDGTDGGAEEDEDIEDDDSEIGDETIAEDIPMDEGLDSQYAATIGGGMPDSTLIPGGLGIPGLDPSLDDDDRRVLESKVNPHDWALELERVGPLLKLKHVQANKEWRSHLEQAQKHSQTINDAFPTTKSALDKIGANLSKAVERIAAKERTINKEFEHLGTEFRNKQMELDAIQESYNNLTREIGELTQDLSDKSESIESIKLSVSERNNSMTDVSPLRRLTAVLTHIKKEVKDMELRIGIVAQTLLQAKLKSQQQHHQRKAEHK